MVPGNGWGSTERGKKSADTVDFAIGRGSEISVFVIVTIATFVNSIIVRSPSGGGEGVGDTIVVKILTATNIAMVPSIITKNMTVVAIINIFLSGMGGGRKKEKHHRSRRWGGRKQSLSSSQKQPSSIFS